MGPLPKSGYKFRFGSLLILCLIFLLFIATVNAAEPTGFERPKIGLALGGGSAKGFAHIGVLKWLEENRIPVDVISGTSIGGLIGGCYAMGMTPDEIANLVTNINWPELFNPVPPYRTMDFRRKEDRRDYPIETQFGLRYSNLSLPDGLGVYQVGLLLSKITLPYSTTANFDQLPIPFRCVATDLKKSEAVVMEDGSLVDALRATMAIPGVFTPVEREGRLLVDGGILNNVPADVAKDMGANVVIAVNLQQNEAETKINGLTGVLLRTIDTVIIDNSGRAVRSADIVIFPPLGDFTATSWEAAAKMIEVGYQAARQAAPALKGLSVDEQTWREYLERRNNRRRQLLPVPTAIEVTGANRINTSLITERLREYTGKPLNIKELETALTDIMGSGQYDGLRYEFVQQNGATVLLIKAIEKPYGPPFIDMAFLLEADGYRSEHVDINVRSRLTYFNLTGPDSEFRVDLGFGTEPHLLGELYQPFGERWFFAPAVFMEQKNSSIFDDDSRLNDFKVSEVGLNCDLGYTFNKLAQARLGLSVAGQGAWVKVGEPLVEDTDGFIRKLQFKYQYSNANIAQLPREGLNLDLKADWFFTAPGTDEQFGLIETKLHWNLPIGQEDSLFTILAGGLSWDGDPPLLQKFTLGGPFKLGTYKTDQFRGDNYFLSDVGYLKYLGSLPLTGKSVYLGTWLEYGGVFESWSDPELDVNISMGLLCPTVFGPVLIGASLGQGDNQFFYVQMGYGF